MYVYRDVTSGASQCITVTRTVTPDSTACCLRLTSDKSQTGKKWDINSTMLGCWGGGARLSSLQPGHACAIISYTSQGSLWPVFFQNVCLSNTFDSTALNHLLTVFTLLSFLFYNFQLSLYKGGKEQLVHREQVELFANVIFVFYSC